MALRAKLQLIENWCASAIYDNSEKVIQEEASFQISREKVESFLGIVGQANIVLMHWIKQGSPFLLIQVTRALAR